MVFNIVNNLAMISPRYMYKDYSEAHHIIAEKLTSVSCTPNTDAWTFLMWSLAGDLHMEYPAHSIEEWGYILGIKNQVTDIIKDKHRVEKFRKHSHRIARNKIFWLFTGTFLAVIWVCFLYLTIPIIIVLIFLYAKIHSNVTESQKVLRNINTYLN